MGAALLPALVLGLVGCGSSSSSEDDHEANWQVIDLSSENAEGGVDAIEYWGLWTEDTDCMLEDGSSICSIAEPFIPMDYDIYTSLTFQNLTSIYNQAGSNPVSRSYYLITSEGNLRGYLIQKGGSKLNDSDQFSSVFDESYSDIKSVIVEKENFGYSLNVSNHELGEDEPILSCLMDTFDIGNAELKCTYYTNDSYVVSELTDAPLFPSIDGIFDMDTFLEMNDLKNGEFSLEVLNYVLDKTGLNL